MTNSLLKQARYWLSIDPDEQTRAELEELLSRTEAGDAAAQTELADRFLGTLKFGTAGLRAALGAGPMRMNRVVVRRAAAGLAAYATTRASAEKWDKITAVVGYDARFNSDVFATETAAIFEAAGISTRLMPAPFPTPVLAWATRTFNAEIGVMVTASHNPPVDNGYKVYLGGNAVAEYARGAQIVPPYDTDIAAAIAAVDDEAIKLATSGWEVLPASIETDYIDQIVKLAEDGTRSLSIVYTAMHGVGGNTMVETLQRVGFRQISIVIEQFEPDPFFPTVAFPNPEEPGALDLAFKQAERVGADLVIANDPDADRAAFAVFDPALGSWRQLSGDEIGALLGVAVLGRLERAGKMTKSAPVFANSVVSSRQLGAIVRAAGFEHRETLTGFKWIARVENLVYGYEEAIGYSVDPDSVKDKDGISAALMVALFAQELKDAGSSLLGVLDELAYTHGVFATDQVSIRVENLRQISAMMGQLQSNPPQSFAGSPVTYTHDMSGGSTELPPTTGMVYRTEDNTRVIVRPSGTEPKLKCYLEVIRAVGKDDGALTDARQQAADSLATVRADIHSALGL